MSIHIQTAKTPFPTTVKPGKTAYTADSAAGAASARTGTAKTDAYVYGVTHAAAAKSMDTSPNAPLSRAEMVQLYSAYLDLGRDHPLWEDIGTLLTKKLAGKDRTHFLTVLSDAGDHMTDFVRQVGMLKGEDRSLYLNTALRNGSGQGLGNLIEATKNLSGDRLTAFLTTADGLGRSAESIRAGELRNFVAAAAAAPSVVDDLIEKISVLDEEDQALFLEAAARAGDQVERFIDTSNLLEGTELTTFLKNAISAGRGLTDLLTLTRDLTGSARTEFLNFSGSLEQGDIENFLLATRGDAEKVPGLMAVTSTLEDSDRANFLSLAAGAGNTLDRLTDLVTGLDPNSGEQSDFLAAAVKAEDGFRDLLQLTETLGGPERANVLSHAAELTFVDLTSFISAAKSDAAHAGDLAEAAGDLDGKNRSYLLYAAAVHPGHIPELTATAQNLKGTELDDFLFTAANIEPGSPDTINTFLSNVDGLSGTDRQDFLAREKRILSGNPEQALAGEYVYLKSVFDEKDFEAVIKTGPDVEAVLSDFEDMGAVQRQTFFSVLDKAGADMIGDLMSVTSRLDNTRSRAFTAYADTLGKASLGDLITAADLALGGGQDFSTFDTLMKTAQSLDPAVDQDFLSAAANAGKHLEKFMELTHEFKGFLQADFLSIADHMARRGDHLFDQFLSATAYLTDKGFLSVQTDVDDGDAVTPETLIQDGAFTGPGFQMEGYLKSTRFLIGLGADDHLMNTWFDTWQNIPRQA